MQDFFRNKKTAIGSIVGSVLFSAWAGAKFMMDWIGRSTILEDAQNAGGLLNRGLVWLFSTPSWVPAIPAIVFTLIMLWLALNHHKNRATQEPEDAPAELKSTGETTHSPTRSLKGCEIYVGQVHIDLKKIENDHIMEFAVRGFNASKSGINILAPSGNVVLESENEDKTRETVTLPTPIILRERGGSENLPPYKEFMVVLEQHLRPTTVSQIMFTLDARRRVFLGFEGLCIKACDVLKPSQVIRLELWDGVNIAKKDHYVVGRRLCLKIHTLITADIKTGNQSPPGTESETPQ